MTGWRSTPTRTTVPAASQMPKPKCARRPWWSCCCARRIAGQCDCSTGPSSHATGGASSASGTRCAASSCRCTVLAASAKHRPWEVQASMQHLPPHPRHPRQVQASMQHLPPQPPPTAKQDTPIQPCHGPRRVAATPQGGAAPPAPPAPATVPTKVPPRSSAR